MNIRKAILLSAPLDWLTRIALRVRAAQIEATGAFDVEAKSKP